MESYEEDKLLLAKANDSIYLSKKRNNSTFLGFLNEHEAQYLKDNLYDDKIVFYGGYENAQRVLMGYDVETDRFPISIIKFSYREEDNLSHRDFLGTILSLGLERTVVGDIITDKGKSFVFVKSENAEYIVSQIDKIRRTGVKAEITDYLEIDNVDNFDFYNLTLPSLRLDVFVSNLCNLSREKANKLIKSELVQINHYTETNNSKNLSIGDVITIRKYGKFVFCEDFGFSKKGKYKVLIKHFK